MTQSAPRRPSRTAVRTLCTTTLALAAALALAGCAGSGNSGGGAAQPGAALGTSEGQAPAAYVAVENVVKQARDRVYPATVRVEARKTEYFRGQRKRLGGFGSGVIFDTDGHVLTNYHVAGRAKEISCTLFNKERVKATLVGSDPWTDLAVIKLDMDEVARKGFAIQFAEFGDSDAMAEGDMVLAIGSPFGLSRSISSGIISCHDRILSEAMELGGGLETGLFNTWLQTDAAINPGNSGGPLANMRGQVIGINTRGGGNDLGFAVPINVAKNVVRQILAYGKVKRSTIGLTFQPLQDLEEFFEVGRTEGAVIASIEPGSPADQAGIRPQDLLVAYDGHKAMGRYPEELFDLRRLIADTPIGSEVPVRLKRSGEYLDVVVTTTELTTVRSDEVNFAAWGLVGQNITQRLADRENLRSTEGVYVTGVRRGEPSERAQVQEGDVVIRARGEAVADVDALQELYDAAKEAGDKFVELRVRRGPAELPKLLKVTWPETDQDDEAEAADDAGDAVEVPPTDQQAVHTRQIRSAQ